MDDPLNPRELPPSEYAREHANLPDPFGENISSTETPLAESAACDSDPGKTGVFPAPDSLRMDEHSMLEESTELALLENLTFARNDASIPFGAAPVDAASTRRSFRHNLFLLLTLTLAAFTLTTWILVRVDSPFGIFSTGPQDIVRAQLRALDRGQLRPAYDMLSARYRGQVSFDVWHQLIVTHWRMFHGEVLGSDQPADAGPGVTLEIYLHGADDKDYRARFTLIRTDGRWWIDDVHWAEVPDQRDISRT